MSELNKRIGQGIRKIRERQGPTQDELAEAAGIPEKPKENKKKIIKDIQSMLEQQSMENLKMLQKVIAQLCSAKQRQKLLLLLDSEKYLLKESGSSRNFTILVKTERPACCTADRRAGCRFLFNEISLCVHFIRALPELQAAATILKKNEIYGTLNTTE